MEGLGWGLIFVFLLFFLLNVAIARWIFRVNDTIKRLDIIIELLKK